MSDRDRGVTRVTRSVVDTVLENLGRVAGRVQERRPLRWDLLESEDAYLVVVDAPGADRQDIDVRFVDGAVHVSIERFREYREGFTMRFPGRGLSFRGTIDLPEAAVIDADRARAELDSDGTLRIHLPKRVGASVPVDAETDTESG